MQQAAEVDELGAAEVLTAFGERRLARERAERDIVMLAAHLADLFNVEAAQGDLVQPGGQRAVQVGGAGTPLVLELAVAEAAGELHLTTWSTRRLIADALDIRHRLPLLWQGLDRGEVLAGLARKVAQATRHLTPGQAALVDEAMAPFADGRLSYARFLSRLEGKVVAADPEGAAARERAAAAEEFAKVGRSSEHGRKTLYVKTGVAEMTRIGATIGYLADALRALGDTDPEDRRRAKAVLVLANPLQALQLLQAVHAHRRGTGSGAKDDGAKDDGAKDDGAEGTSTTRFLQRFRPADVPACLCRTQWTGLDPGNLLPTVVLYLHVHADSVAAGDGVVRCEGEGPLTLSYLREVLGPRARVVAKKVLDPANLAPVDAYEIPDRHREAVHLLTPADIFPFASGTSRDQQVDHTERYLDPHRGGPPGQTRIGNLGPMATYHHRVKTHAGWQVRQPFPGIFVWRAPHGSIYLVDHSGTRQVRGPTQTAPPPRPRPTTPDRTHDSPLEDRLRQLLAAA